VGDCSAFGAAVKGMEVAARALGVQIRVQEVRDPTEFDKAFEATTREGARALMVLPDPMFVSQAGRIVALSAKSRLPAMYAHREICGCRRPHVLWGKPC
jgi:DNA-binding LacI/PurR family transcriptional regulator